MSPAAPLGISLNDGMYARLQDLIHARTGLKFSDHQRESTARMLIKEMKHAGAATPEQYFSLLNNQPINAVCWDDLIKALTICETYFFRDLDQMQMLRKYIIPDLLARHWNDHTLRLWSAGCATGEEAYTLALLLKQEIPDLEHWKITILATDINKHALEKAKRGLYRDWSFREHALDDSLLHAYFTHDYSGYQIHPGIKEMVHFTYLNLSEESFPSPDNMTDRLDLILCRNVTMYLSKAVIQQLARRFYECLLPGGWLMLGASESNDQVYDQFKALMYEKAMVYQKIVANSPAPRAIPPVDPISTWPAPDFRDNAPHQPDSVVFPPQLPPTAAPTISAQSTGDSSQKLYQTGLAFIKEHKFEEAKKCLLEHLIQHPRDVEAQYQVAMIDANSGRLEEAQQLARQIIEQNPLFSKAYIILAMVYQETGELNLAVPQLKKVLYLDPNDILANFNLSVLYQKQGLLTEALRYRQQAIKLASKLQPDDIIPDSDHLSVSDFLNKAQ
jgi:chemotaxis protein methyltransferase CheR